MPRKWSADSDCGPLVLLCERILKRMIKHGWPAAYSASTNEDHAYPSVAYWQSQIEGGETPAFWNALSQIIEVVASANRVSVQYAPPALALNGGYFVNKKSGRIVSSARNAPF